MYIHGAPPRQFERTPAGSTYEDSNRVGTHPADSAFGARRASNEVEGARDAARSALHNSRFGTMLEKISDPRSSGTLALAGHGASGVDFGLALSRYAENSD